MRVICLRAAALLVMLLNATAGAQNELVHVRYFAAQDKTEVRTDTLQLLRAPTQFLQAGLFATYRTARPVEPPANVTLRLFSYADAPLYGQREQRVCTITTDGETWLPPGPQTYLPMTDTLSRRKPKPPGEPRRETDFTHWEQFTTYITFAQLTRMATAQQVQLRLGDTVAPLDARALEIVRAFAARLTPGAPVPATPAPTPAGPSWRDVPSQFTNAPLAEALKFLKKELSDNASDKLNTGERFEIKSVANCQIKYRIVPPPPAPDPPNASGAGTARERYTPPSAEFTVNLADLDPAAVQVNQTGTRIGFATRADEPKIKHHQSNTDIFEAKGELLLRRNSVAPQIGHALVRAIQLCQEAKP